MQKDAGRPLRECFDLVAANGLSAIVALGLLDERPLGTIRAAIRRVGRAAPLSRQGGLTRAADRQRLLRQDWRRDGAAARRGLGRLVQHGNARDDPSRSLRYSRQAALHRAIKWESLLLNGRKRRSEHFARGGRGRVHPGGACGGGWRSKALHFPVLSQAGRLMPRTVLPA